jgi:hypothetical protein
VAALISLSVRYIISAGSTISRLEVINLSPIQGYFFAKKWLEGSNPAF